MTQATAADGSADWALPVGAAATLLVLGGVAFAATRRRRAWEEDADFVPPVINRPATRPIAERSVAADCPLVKPVATTGEAPATCNARAALIEQMVAAEPDEANPFKTRKARRHRARLIVQSMPEAASDPVATSQQQRYVERPMQDHRVLASL